LFTLAGLEVNRLIRVAYGPISLDPALSRGRHRELAPAELEGLYSAAGLEAPASTAEAPNPRPRRPAPGRKRTARRE
jgi:hypothetical protein